MAENPVKTLVIDNFTGSMTMYQNGDINSGRAYALPVGGYNPIIKPGQLTWSRTPTRIDAGGTIITDLIMDAKERVESGILYVYAIGHTGRFYKIQVNDPASYNPDYDNPVLIATLSVNSPTFTRGGSISFFGATERVYIGHDKGVSRINFDGTAESFIGVLGSWTQNVPRPLKQFLGKIYIGNGTNIAEIDSTATVTSYTKLSPSFPDNTQVRDIDVTPDGTYLQMVVSRLALPDITATTQEASPTASSESYVFKWNGTDVGYTSFDTFPTFSLNANSLFQNYQYTFGQDQYGAAVYNPTEKVLTLQEVDCPLPNAISSNGNLLLFMSPLYYNGFMEANLFCFGRLDFEYPSPDVGPGYYDLVWQQASGTETDVIRVPYMGMVSNFGLGFSSNGYANNIYGTAKIYFSTLETSSAPTTKYKLYKWTPEPSPTVPQGTPLVNAYYETQTQLFSKKVTIKEVRIYGESWKANASFTIDLIGSSGTAMTGASKTFTAGTNLTVGDDFAWYTPQCKPTYAIGLGVLNVGTANQVIKKVEIDYSVGGK